MPAKISEQFETRIRELPADGLVRALVLLSANVPAAPGDRRPSADERRETALAMRTAATGALGAIDTILSTHGGKRLASAAGSLGTVPVETTAAGIRALAEASEVRAILEDQAIEPLSGLRAG